MVLKKVYLLLVLLKHGFHLFGHLIVLKLLLYSCFASVLVNLSSIIY